QQITDFFRPIKVVNLLLGRAIIFVIPNKVLSDYHFIREKVVRKDISVHFISSKDQLADLLTKPLSSQLFLSLRRKLLTSYQSSV
ncbi:MAG: hypothetical protein Q8835_03140, partial [Sweet potato little leaf phytoplasma]|nr:hypothetical protein [Sweet potato little leaf phytoplasma]